MRDDTPTLLAAGILSYVAETMAHEALGHGGVCLLGGAHVTVLAPLWMRCSETTGWLVGAGPAMNVLLAVIFAALLRLTPPRSALVGLLLWQSFAFNALVACGYLGVGAATGFGDWPYVFQAVSPGIIWRAPAIVIAACGYFVCLRVAAGLFQRLAGSGAGATASLRRRAVVPAAGAACVAVTAEIYGGRATVLPLLLAVGCTVGVGLSLTSMDDVVARANDAARDLGAVQRAPAIIIIAAGVTLGFVGLIGPGWILE